MSRLYTELFYVKTENVFETLKQILPCSYKKKQLTWKEIFSTISIYMNEAIDCGYINEKNQSIKPFFQKKDMITEKGVGANVVFYENCPLEQFGIDYNFIDDNGDNCLMGFLKLINSNDYSYRSSCLQMNFEYLWNKTDKLNQINSFKQDIPMLIVQALCFDVLFNFPKYKKNTKNNRTGFTHEYWIKKIFYVYDRHPELLEDKFNNGGNNVLKLALKSKSLKLSRILIKKYPGFFKNPENSLLYYFREDYLNQHQSKILFKRLLLKSIEYQNNIFTYKKDVANCSFIEYLSLQQYILKVGNILLSTLTPENIKRVKGSFFELENILTPEIRKRLDISNKVWENYCKHKWENILEENVGVISRNSKKLKI